MLFCETGDSGVGVHLGGKRRDNELYVGPGESELPLGPLGRANSWTVVSVGLELRIKLRLERIQVRLLRTLHDSTQGMGVGVPAPCPELCLIFSPTPTQMEGQNMRVFRWVGAEKVLIRGKSSVFMLREHLLKFCQRLQANR